MWDLCILFAFIIQSSFASSWKDSEESFCFQTNIKCVSEHMAWWSSTVNPPFVSMQSHYVQSLALETSKCCSARCTQLYGVTGRDIITLLFITAPVYHWDVMAPVVFWINYIIYWHAGTGSYSRDITSRDYEAGRSKNNKTLVQQPCVIIRNMYSWKESSFIWVSLIRKSQETKLGLCLVSEGETNRGEESAPFQSVAERSERSAHLPDLPPTLFCPAMLSLWHESSLIHVCCTNLNVDLIKSVSGNADIPLGFHHCVNM